MINFNIIMKNTRGEFKGKRFTKRVSLKNQIDIYGFLWDVADSYEKNQCDYIVEWYRPR